MWEIFSSQMTKVSILRRFLGKNGDFWISTSCFNRPKMIAFSFGFFSHIEKKNPSADDFSCKCCKVIQGNIKILGTTLVHERSIEGPSQASSNFIFVAFVHFIAMVMCTIKIYMVDHKRLKVYFVMGQS